jgi:hypothetical protein
MPTRNDVPIYTGHGEITIWDSVNGYRNLGYVEESSIVGAPVFHKILDGNYRQIYSTYNFDCSIFNVSQDMVDELESRKDIRQTVWIVGDNSTAILSNIYLTYGEERVFSNEDPQLMNIEARTFESRSLRHYTNLLGITGSFENATSGRCAGWGGGNSPSQEVTFMTASGGTYCQKFTSGELSPAGAGYISCSVDRPSYRSRQVVASVWGMISGSATTTTDLQMWVDVLDENGSTILTSTTSWPTITGTNYGRVSTTFNTPHNQLITSYRMIVGYVEAEVEKVVVIDNAQLEFREASNFKDY